MQNADGRGRRGWSKGQAEQGRGIKDKVGGVGGGGCGGCTRRGNNFPSCMCLGRCHYPCLALSLRAADSTAIYLTTAAADCMGLPLVQLVLQLLEVLIRNML